MTGPILTRPSHLTHAAWILPLLALLALIFAAAIVEVEQMVRADGQVRTEEPSAQIVAPMAGRILQVHVREGDAVTKGARLLTLEPDVNGLSLREARLQMVRYEASYAAYAEVPSALTMRDDAEVTAQRIIRRSVEAELLAAQAQLRPVAKQLAESQAQVDIEAAALRRQEALEPLVRNRVERMAELARSGFQSPMSLLSAQQELVDAREQTLIASKRLKRASEEVRRHDATLAAARMDLARLKAQKAADAHIQWLQAQAVLERLTDLSRNSAIDSPADGVIEYVSQQIAGNAVSAGERLMAVVPASAQLALQLRIRNEDYPFIKPGQLVDVKFEAYPFTIYGSRLAVIVRVLREVSPQDTAQASYTAIARLLPDSTNQTALDIRHGMKFRGDIEVGRQRPIDIWLAPFIRFGHEVFREGR